jgi:hypothetical protein
LSASAKATAGQPSTAALHPLFRLVNPPAVCGMACQAVKKAVRKSDGLLKAGGGCVTCQRTLLLKIFYAQTIEKFVGAIPDFIEIYRTEKKVSGNQKT